MNLFSQTLFVTFLFYNISLVKASTVCDCDYHRGGCVISEPAVKGSKCRCSYKGFWRCRGFALPCSDNEYCPGGLSNYCACELGGGDCDAYDEAETRVDCSKTNQKNKPAYLSIKDVDCDCDYHPGGCIISTPAPLGYKCRCSHRGFWTCSGWPYPCGGHEYCPGGLYTYCGCKQGGGDCGGYDSSGPCNYTRPEPPTCDCNKQSDWDDNSQYYISDVKYDLSKIQRSNFSPQVIGTKNIPNASEGKQEIQFWLTKGLTTESSFQFTKGIKIGIGMSFESGFPLGKAITSITYETSYDFTWGKKKSISLQFSSRFICNGPPKQHTVCTVSVQRAEATVPYTMTLVHKVIPDCKCESKGLWSGLDAFDLSLTAKNEGACNRLVDNQCVNYNNHNIVI